MTKTTPELVLEYHLKKMAIDLDKSKYEVTRRESELSHAISNLEEAKAFSTALEGAKAKMEAAGFLYPDLFAPIDVSIPS